MSAIITPKAIVEKRGEENPNHYRVSPDWSVAGVDRPVSFGVIVNGKKVAERLARAIEDGVAYPYEGIKTDINGKTYVATGYNVMARRANADLKRLGY